MNANQVKPLGGKGASSPVVAAEQARHRDYLAALATVPVVNNNEAARQLRGVLARFNPALAQHFNDLHLEF